MIGHDRKILATLGIDIWVPRYTTYPAANSSQIWRDQQIAEQRPNSETQAQRPDQPQFIEPADRLFTAPEVIAKTQIEPETVQETPQVIHKPVTESPLAAADKVQIAAFSVQAHNVSHCSILVDATALTEAQQQLWLNIQHSLPGQYHVLEWPFPLPSFQDSRGVHCYVQGFIDAVAYEKSVLSLGDIPHVQHSKVTRLASLQEMLDQPRLKKRLWQFMYKASEGKDKS